MDLLIDGIFLRPSSISLRFLNSGGIYLRTNCNSGGIYLRTYCNPGGIDLRANCSPGGTNPSPNSAPIVPRTFHNSTSISI